jgi:hypothetical protein
MDYIAPPLLINMSVGRFTSDIKIKMFDFTLPTDIGLLQIMINFVFYNYKIWKLGEIFVHSLVPYIYIFRPRMEIIQ